MAKKVSPGKAVAKRATRSSATSKKTAKVAKEKSGSARGTAKKVSKSARKSATSTVKRKSVKSRPPFQLERALSFLSALKLPQPARAGLGLDGDKPPISLTEGIDQSLMVGANIVSLAKELSEDQRSLVVHSLLLAQLAATKAVKKDDLTGWYDKYFETLATIGWLIQDNGFTKLDRKGRTIEVHEAVIKVVATALGGAPTALALVQTTLDGIKSMGDGTPWMTLFKRTSESTKVARFQVTAAEATSDGGTMVTLMAFKLKTNTNLTQVLFFKMSSAKVVFHHSTGKVTLLKSLATTLGPVVEAKVTAHLKGNIESISI